MMKKIAFAFLLSLAWCLGFAQSQGQARIDSMKHELSADPPDTSRVMLMVGLADQYKYHKADSSLFYGQQALALARQINYPKGECQSLLWIGFTFYSVRNYARAMEMELKALRIAEKHNFTELKAEILNRIGAIYVDVEDYPKALDNLQQSKWLSDSLHYYGRSAVSQNLLGRTYFSMNQLDSSLHYLQMANDNINLWKVEWLLAPNLRNLGVLQAKMGDNRLALDYLFKGLAANYATSGLRINYLTV